MTQMGNYMKNGKKKQKNITKHNPKHIDGTSHPDGPNLQIYPVKGERRTECPMIDFMNREQTAVSEKEETFTCGWLRVNSKKLPPKKNRQKTKLYPETQGL